MSNETSAWEGFVRRFHRPIAAVVLRMAGRLGDSSTQTVDDLIQETYAKLCGDSFRLLREFDQRHPDAFIGFVRVVAANVVPDHFKSWHCKKRGANKIESISETFVPSAGEDHSGSATAMERAVLISEIERHLNLCISGAVILRSKRMGTTR